MERFFRIKIADSEISPSPAEILSMFIELQPMLNVGLLRGRIGWRPHGIATEKSVAEGSQGLNVIAIDNHNQYHYGGDSGLY